MLPFLLILSILWYPYSTRSKSCNLTIAGSSCLLYSDISLPTIHAGFSHKPHFLLHFVHLCPACMFLHDVTEWPFLCYLAFLLTRRKPGFLRVISASVVSLAHIFLQHFGFLPNCYIYCFLLTLLNSPKKNLLLFILAVYIRTYLHGFRFGDSGPLELSLASKKLPMCHRKLRTWILDAAEGKQPWRKWWNLKLSWVVFNPLSIQSTELAFTLLSELCPGLK